MKTLLLLRHAKSSKTDSSLRDYDRPLSERGVTDAGLIGSFVRQQKIHPDVIVSSPAKRARQTAELVLKSAGLEVELRFDERIYEASVRRLLEVISQIEDARNTAMLVGHNPGFEELFESLTGEARHLPTAALACIETGTETWSKVGVEAGNLKWFIAPKELRHD
jgi:phosphohistidine phosphatase